MAHHVIWLGPVSREQRAGATVRDAVEHFVPCVGAECRARSEGRGLSSLLSELGVGDDDEVTLAAFSAGGSAIKQYLAAPQDRARVRAVLLADATYELRGSDGRPSPSPALVALVTEAAASGRQFVLMTASGAANVYQGASQPSGAETLERIVADAEASGQSFELDAPAGIDLHPRKRWGVGGNVHLLDFGDQFRHEEHATLLAPRLWPALYQPWRDGAGAAELKEPEPERAESGAVAVGAVGACALLAMWWWRRRGARQVRNDLAT
jgi:hypothetical protein